MSPFGVCSPIHLPNTHSFLPIRPKPVTRISKNTQFCRPALRSFIRPGHYKNSLAKIVRSTTSMNRELNAEDAALLVSTCITRNLPPVLSLQSGLHRIKEAVEELQFDASPYSRGMYRFQVAVPPGAKSLNWFWSQLDPSKVFPIFFLSSENRNPTYKTIPLGTTRGIFGVGSAITFKGYIPQVLGKNAASQSYILEESTCPKAYGFVDIEFNEEKSTVKRQSGSVHLFIPQIELDEYEDMSFLVATLAWDNSSFFTHSEALQAFQIAYDQMMSSCVTHSQVTHFSLSSFNKVEEHGQMVCVNPLVLDENQLKAQNLELGSSWSQCNEFYARLSPTFALGRNMHLIDKEFCPVNYFSQACPNINLLWASLMIEECVRLGLTYFCIAPGSRSSPLTLAATSHPLATCIACIDERSLSFHALGYAKGSRKPAVVITSSGTAVSNLLPAVVEASHSFVPLLLLTADRPPELIDVGANQAINQVDHFGTFVRHFVRLPPPTDDISARFVLTTVDYAVLKATSSPQGPVHVNCPFREPLSSSPSEWNHGCISGLEIWMSNTIPFTKSIPLQQSMAHNVCWNMTEVLNLIQGANHGLLVFGSIHKEDDVWAALLLAKHLQWPVAVDIQSGLRLRKYFSSFLCSNDALFIDHIDQLLLSESFRKWMRADVIVQIGSRITGRRISQMIQDSSPCSYVLVDDHPGRHDPSHIVTHRILGPISHFCDNVIDSCSSSLSEEWREAIRGLGMMVALETSLLISSEKKLSEPFVARKIFETLRCGSAVFFGNSMPIRDADMYGTSWVKCTHGSSLPFSAGLPCHFVQVTGNRGASGIDGVISTAVGFSVGCKKRVLLVIGDVSFLHDTNGLALLRQRMPRKPMVILVLNNHGGAIFSQLPVANTTEISVLDQFFYTSHNVSIHNLCLAHSVKHISVRSKMELEDALLTSQREVTDCVVEIESGIEENFSIHSMLRNFLHQASDDALSIVSKLSYRSSTSQADVQYKIAKMEYSLYRVQLNAPPTSTQRNSLTATSRREGFIISIFLEDGTAGFGEVAPLEIHQENLLDVEEQLRFLIHVMEGKTIDRYISLLNYSVSSWIWNSLGIPPGSLFPSLRCGLEMAIITAVANRSGTSLLDILHPSLPAESPSVRVCALIDSYRSPKETALIASNLVQEGFTTIKIKVARGMDPDEDIAVIQEVRKEVGERIVLRVDANRKWRYSEAVKFACGVQDCNLQYIEEPVDNEDDILKFCEETGLPVALDETINQIMENPLQLLEKFTHSGVTALVLKPSVLGGFENAALIARWAHLQGKSAIVSAAFESAVSLSAYVQFACFLDLQRAETRKLMNEEPPVSTAAHGFGTYKWFDEEVTTEPLSFQYNPKYNSVVADAAETGEFLRQLRINPRMISRTFIREQVKDYSIPVITDTASLSIRVLESAKTDDDDDDDNGNLVVFLHGFLGGSEDWIPIMKAMSTKCIAIDLPGHGGTKLEHPGDVLSTDLSIPALVDILCKVLTELTLPGKKVTLVGYSMGARIALYMALKHTSKVERAVIISGSPGLIDVRERALRLAKDEFRARALVSNGSQFFTDTWYSEHLWTSLRNHPHFKQLLEKRSHQTDLNTLAKVLSDSSIGKQQSLWEDLKHLKAPLQIMVGEKDPKFRKIAHDMQKQIHQGNDSSSAAVVEIPSAGHAVHLENPLAVITAIRHFIAGN